jgi:hypothetical protein
MYEIMTFGTGAEKYAVLERLAGTRGDAEARMREINRVNWDKHGHFPPAVVACYAGPKHLWANVA